jgi:hypothetical protein
MTKSGKSGRRDFGIRKGPEKDTEKARRAKRSEKSGDKDLSIC